jgi:hypothetical protein
MTTAEGRDDVRDDWKGAVNMTRSEIEHRLDTEEWQSVGDTGGDGEPTGRRSGRRIVDILGTKKADLDGRRRGVDAQGRRLRPSAPRAAAERRRGAHDVALLAHEPGQRSPEQLTLPS